MEHTPNGRHSARRAVRRALCIAVERHEQTIHPPPRVRMCLHPRCASSRHERRAARAAGSAGNLCGRPRRCQVRSRRARGRPGVRALRWRVLALEAGETRIALVTLDLGRVFRKSWIDQLRETVRKTSKVSYVLVNASHTHSGPALQDDCSTKPVPAWETSALDKITKAIDEAYQRLVPVQLGTGYGTSYIGHNRLRVNADGMAVWFERNLTKIPTSPVDPTLSVLRFDAADGKPLQQLGTHDSHVYNVGFHPSGKFLVSANALRSPSTSDTIISS